MYQASKLGVLGATDDPGVVTRLYREALSLSETSVEHLNSGAGLRHLTTGKFAIGSRGVSGVEAGSLLLANGSICCLGDIGKQGPRETKFCVIWVIHKFVGPYYFRLLFESGPRAPEKQSGDEAGFVREAEIAFQGYKTFCF